MASPGQKCDGYGHLMALGQVSITTHFMLDGQTKERERTPVWTDPIPLTVSFATISLMINVLSCPPQAIRLRRRSVKQRIWTWSSTQSKDTDSFNVSLVDPASMSVIGAVDGQGMLQSPGFNGPEEKKVKNVEKE